MLQRDTARFSQEEHHYASLGDFYSQPPETGLITINYGDAPLDLLHIDREAGTTLVIFHAALAGSKVTTYPLFSGLGVTKDLDVNLICVSDPSLTLDLELAWFAGNQHQPLQRDLPNVLRHLLSHYSDHQELVFFGSSGGGFASLFYSFGFPESTAITMNPQTDISEYNQKFVEEYALAAWSTDDLASVPIVTDLGKLYRDGFPNRVIFLQNILDGHHRDRHLARWMRAISTPSDHLFLLMGNWGRGHIPPDKNIVRLTLTAACSGQFDILEDLGFVQAPLKNYPASVLLEYRKKVQAL